MEALSQKRDGRLSIYAHTGVGKRGCDLWPGGVRQAVPLHWNERTDWPPSGVTLAGSVS